MLNHYFLTGPIPVDQIHGSYDLRLVALSYLVATFASYLALDITSRIRDLNNTNLSINLWVIGGAFAMGAGIWSMHFIGMLAFSMPHMPVVYDSFYTALSMVVAIIASYFALSLLKKRSLLLSHILFGGIVLGFAIAAMHYTGMEAMKVNMTIQYLPSLFILSLIIATIASQAALWLALKSTEVVASIRFRLKCVSAFIMGTAICGMHYTGMAAAVFTNNNVTPMLLKGADLSPEIMSISIAGITIVILAIALFASTYKESLNQQLLLTARQAGKAEVATTVLHNVGNVLNSVNVSSSLISEKIAQSKLAALVNFSSLIHDNKDHLADFFKNDPRAAKIPEFIASLSEYWQAEREALLKETSALNKNIDHIKHIISTQQDFSRAIELVQLEEIEKIIEEALLIVGIEENPSLGIDIQRNYTTLKPVLVDKVKLLQILVNLFHNAKDSIIDSGHDKKRITIATNHSAHTFTIQISDTGVGIVAENLTRVFSYGYTTKRYGNGFGLHSSAISADEMGGSLIASSEGPEKGACFILQLPYERQHRILNLKSKKETTLA